MTRLVRLLLPSLLMALLAACPQLPRPFMHDGVSDNPLLQPLGLRGIHVPPVAGSEVGGALAQALVTAFERNEMAATLRQPGPGSLILESDVAEEPSGRVVVKWTVREHAPTTGEAPILAAYAQSVTASQWRNPSGASVAALAREAVAGLSQQLREEARQEDPKAMPSVTLVLSEVPGDGPRSLRRAMITALRREGIAVVETGAAVVDGKVQLSDAEAPDTQNVRIAWQVRTPEGAELGVIEQQNVIPKGKLSGAWGGEAYLIAEGGAMGVADLLSRVKSKLKPKGP